MMRIVQRGAAAAALAAGLVFTACAQPPPSPPATVAPPTVTPAPAAVPWLERKRTFTLAPDASTVTIRVQEQFLGVKVPEDAVGTSKSLTGRITLSPDPAIVASESKLEFDARSLRTGAGGRDGQIRTTLNAFQIPTIGFQPQELRDLQPAQRTDGTFRARLLGEMSVRGASRPIAFDVEGRLDGLNLSGTAKGSLTMSEFGMTAPKTADILWVEDLVRLEIAFSAAADD